MIYCYACGFDLRATPTGESSLLVTAAEIEFTAKLLQIINTGVAKVTNTISTYSHLYFTVLRQLMKIIGMRSKKIGKLRKAISDTYGIENYTNEGERQPDVQEQSIQKRRQLLGLTRCLLEEWPHRFISLSQKYGVWSSTWLRHLGSGSRGRIQMAPFWFFEIIQEYLNQTRYCPSFEEVRAASNYLLGKGAVLNKSSVSRLLGVTVIRRKDLL